MGKLNFVLTKIIYWPILLCVTVLLSSFEFSPGEFYQGYSDPAFYILVGLALFFIVLYFDLVLYKVFCLLFFVVLIFFCFY